MATTYWSPAALQKQFDAVAALFPDTVWVSWVFDVWRTTTVTEGRLWWKKTHTQRHTEELEWERVEVPVERESKRLLVSLPSELRHLTLDFTGWIRGLNVYAHEHDEEFLVRPEWQGNSSAVTPGTRVDLTAPVVVLEVEGL
jgi:hypothetical protein